MYFPRTKYVSMKRLEQLKRNHGSPEYQNWRKSVLKRDGRCCQYPDCVEKKKLEVHHIKKFATNIHLRFERYNGITLCKKHHRQIGNNEESYELLFLSISEANEKKCKD